ncbi:MAG TPA: hypothetical protein VLS48_04095 [Anaerolineales bacterium]|nr:hypothetical protein [Anaerolineales bacterium]
MFDLPVVESCYTFANCEAQGWLVKSISHDREDETLEGKARWFQSLSLKERAEMLCQYTDMILAVNPAIVEQKDAQPVAGRVRVLSEA